MDIDDPIQQFLKNTGWSCDDLLEKLHRYKSQKENKSDQVASTETSSKPCENSCYDTKETPENDHCKGQIITIKKTNETSNTCLQKSEESPANCNIREEFSDTDEEECEVNVTHSNIIDEIIDDIGSTDNIEQLNCLDDSDKDNLRDKYDAESEVTEVRVIEVNENEGYFEEENTYASAKKGSKSFEYLETFPRKAAVKLHSIDLTGEDDTDVFNNEYNTGECASNEKSDHNSQTSLGNNLVSKESLIANENVLISEIVANDSFSFEEKGTKLITNEEIHPIVANKEKCRKPLNFNQRINDCENKVGKTFNNLPHEHPCGSTLNKDDDQHNENVPEQESTPTNLEDIRNNLKLQLNCLRTRKKGHFLQQLRNNVMKSSECSKEELNSVDKTNTISFIVKESDKTIKNEEHLYTQTNEFGLVILSVEGGIDLEEQSNEKYTESNKPSSNITNDASFHTITPTLENSMSSNNFVLQSIETKGETNEASEVFDEIRKIIRKQRYNEKSNPTGTDLKSTNAINNFKFFTESVNEKSNDRIDLSCTSTDNSQSSFVNDDTNQNADKNSPFVSNTLDEFLTGNSKLNISYKVPKCGAEEGLTASYHEDSPLILKKIVTLDKEQTQMSKKTEKIKAKTVAQKRKLLEKQRLKELKKESKIKKQQPKNDVTERSTDKSFNKNKQSYIEINNKKLWVKGTKPNTCVAKINSLIDLGPPQQNKKRKLSLLTELEKKSGERIKYLPGPLSKKSSLQVTGQDNWETKTKSLPKVTLEVCPKIGYSLPSIIINRLPKCDGVVTADLAEFAISVFKTKCNTDTQDNIFKFPMKYVNNQEKIIVKKRKLTPLEYNIDNTESNRDKCISGVIKSVINDLIKYVEIKEIAPTLIKEEDSEYSYIESKLDKLPAIAENISSIIRKPQKKKSKVELELLRLNCKVVNVEVEENSNEESCNKPYCQLGCVCKSLKCDGLITYHCQKISCMLECKCPREKSIEYDKLMLPAGTDILSKDTVTRIEDEAKKDLAKIEREFTQTVIHTNDKTIVVGMGARHKTKRSKRAPVKYSDYINSNFESIEQYGWPKQQKKNIFSKDCIVSLERLNLKEIIPYCLFHNLYNCHCEGKSVSASSIVKNPILKFDIAEKLENKTVDKQSPKNVKSSPSKQPKIQKGFNDADSFMNSENIGEIKMSTSGRPIRLTKKLMDDFTFFHKLDNQLTSCARTLGISHHTKVNRKRSIKDLNKLIKNDFSNNISQPDILKANFSTNSSDTLEVDILKKQLILELESRKKSMSLVENPFNESRHKRKQVLEVRNDDGTLKPAFNQDLAIQRRKRTGLITRRNTVVESVFDGEIIIDDRNMELLQKMGNKTVMEGYARLLPWAALINSFNKGDIRVWCMIDQPSRLLINKSDKIPPKNYIDIRHATQSTEVISWILTNKLPVRYHEDHVSFILKQTKDNYEICGLCTKHFDGTSFTNEINKDTEFSTKMSTDKDAVPFKHKDLNGVQQLLYISEDRFKLQELVEENLASVGETSVEKNKLYMWAALPEIYRMCKWRMIFLNSDFTFLYFTKIKYSIKYTDLLNASNKAKDGNCTVILRNSIICHPYDHSAFGIYFDAHYQDRLFIGPYFKQHKDDDIETLRYINQSLVCTESFNKMQGKTNYKCGHWLVERPYSRTAGKFTVDSTNTSLKNALKRQKSMNLFHSVKKPEGALKKNETIIITQNSDYIRVLDSKPRTPEEFNRYIITNIPHLGYLGAFQHEDSSEIDVSWPFENKMLRFPSVICATDFLQCRFSSLLQPVPETFKISIVVLTDIDLEKTKPIDASILSGHYICGEFGCYNVKTITNEFCIIKLGMTREELLRIFARRAQSFVKEKINELANLLNIPKTERGGCDITNILSKAQADIETLAKIGGECIKQKNELILQKRELTLKTFRLISDLPDNERRVESWKFRQILRKKSILLPKTVTETIDIADSDEEEGNASSPQESSCQDFEHNAHISSKADQDSSFMNKNSELAKMTSLSRDDSVEESKTAMSPYPSQIKLQSILKSNTAKTLPTPITIREDPSGSASLLRQPVSTSTQFSPSLNKIPIIPTQQYLTGVKLVKTPEGKVMLMPDKPPSVTGNQLQRKPTGGKQLVIKNNRILSVKSISPPIPENVLGKTPNSPPKTIILKKSALLHKPKVSLDKTINSVTSLIQNTVNETSALKNTEIISLEGDHKPTKNIQILNDTNDFIKISYPTNITIDNQTSENNCNTTNNASDKHKKPSVEVRSPDKFSSCDDERTFFENVPTHNVNTKIINNKIIGNIVINEDILLEGNITTPSQEILFGENNILENAKLINTDEKPSVKSSNVDFSEESSINEQSVENLNPVLKANEDISYSLIILKENKSTICDVDNEIALKADENCADLDKCFDEKMECSNETNMNLKLEVQPEMEENVKSLETANTSENGYVAVLNNSANDKGFEKVNDLPSNNGETFLMNAVSETSSHSSRAATLTQTHNAANDSTKSISYTEGMLPNIPNRSSIVSNTDMDSQIFKINKNELGDKNDVSIGDASLQFISYEQSNICHATNKTNTVENNDSFETKTSHSEIQIVCEFMANEVPFLEDVQNRVFKEFDQVRNTNSDLIEVQKCTDLVHHVTSTKVGSSTIKGDCAKTTKNISVALDPNSADIDDHVSGINNTETSPATDYTLESISYKNELKSSRIKKTIVNKNKKGNTLNKCNKISTVKKHQWPLKQIPKKPITRVNRKKFGIYNKTDTNKANNVVINKKFHKNLKISMQSSKCKTNKSYKKQSDKSELFKLETSVTTQVASNISDMQNEIECEIQSCPDNDIKETVNEFSPILGDILTDEQLDLKTTVNNNFAINKSTEKGLHTPLHNSSNENENIANLLLDSDEAVVITSYLPINAKFPLSKRISNVVVHTLAVGNCPNNYDSAKENAEPANHIDSECNCCIEKAEQQINLEKNDCFKNKSIPNTVNKGISDVGSDESIKTTKNYLVNDGTKYLKSNISPSQKVPYKKTIKYVRAKLNTAFTIDKNSPRVNKKRSPSIHRCKVTKKSITYDSNFPVRMLWSYGDRGRRIRKKMISTSDLIYATEILGTEHKKGRNNIVKKINTLAEHTMTTSNPPMKIDKDNFLKNAALVEKCIDIGNMKRKLQANICEDNINS